MLTVALGVLAVAGMAGFIYVVREGLGLEGFGLTVLRTLGLGALLLLLVNPGDTVRVSGGPPVVLLDESLSMGVEGGRWSSAVDTARAIAGTNGKIIRFGSGLTPFDTLPPSAGTSRLADAVRAARAAGGPIYLVTDGEIEDAGSIARMLLQGITTVLLPRDTLPDAALLAVRLPDHVHLEDSIEITLTIGTWNSPDSSRAQLEVAVGDRTVRTVQLRLPPSPGTATRRFALRAKTLPLGTTVLHLRLKMPGDSVSADDERDRMITVSRQRPVVVLVDPADWEGRFLVKELSGILERSVDSYARVTSDRWVDTRTLQPTSLQDVRAAAERAGLLVTRGSRGTIRRLRRTARPLWQWPAVNDTLTRLFPGDWYITAAIPPSPLGRRLTGIAADSLPPLTGMIPLVPAGDDWVGLTAQRGRRGPLRPVIIGRDSAGARRLITAGTGLWRWSFRGGAAREAYRAVLAAGVEWLLGSEAVRTPSKLAVSSVVARGEPVVFRWNGDSVPDSLVVTITRQGESQSITSLLRPAEDGTAAQMLEPGIYDWSVSTLHVSGKTAVERYSDEFHPRPITIGHDSTAAGAILVERFARENWWLFAIVVAALAGEWAWRHRRGLP
ncbi:MAG: hypothetical protein ACE5HT_03680 [Gemmatimonadales bacterium]